MIIVCEPQCKGISHSIVNSGYLYGLLLAYPKDKIILFAEKTHFQEIRNTFSLRSKRLTGVKSVDINFNQNRIFSFLGIVRYTLLLKKIFDRTLSYGTDKIFFLSTNPIILFVVKFLKQLDKYKKINCTFVLHGELEDIANKEYREPYLPVIKYKSLTSNIFIIVKKYLKQPQLLPKFIGSILLIPYNVLYKKYSLFYKRRFRVKSMMMWKHTNQYNYISMSPHVTNNAKKYLDIDYLNIHTIVLPIIFAKPTPDPNNEHIKFAVFGYGDSAQMQKMLTILSQKKITKPYEIRIVSMDSRGTEGFTHITRLSNGKILTRKEMERAITDIDMFINLYDKTRHRFGCSLSILESLSYLKPVLHLSNPGYNYFNNPKKPIGYKVKNIDKFVKKMVDLIENYSKYKKQLDVFRSHMMDCRKVYNIKNNLNDLRSASFFK